jgi:hypothetical protein
LGSASVRRTRARRKGCVLQFSLSPFLRLIDSVLSSPACIKGTRALRIRTLKPTADPELSSRHSNPQRAPGFFYPKSRRHVRLFRARCHRHKSPFDAERRPRWSRLWNGRRSDRVNDSGAGTSCFLSLSRARLLTILPSPQIDTLFSSSAGMSSAVPDQGSFDFDSFFNPGFDGFDTNSFDLVV